MQKSVMSQNMANPSMLPLPNRVQYLPVFVYSPENFIPEPGVSSGKLGRLNASCSSDFFVWMQVADCQFLEHIKYFTSHSIIHQCHVSSSKQCSQQFQNISIYMLPGSMVHWIKQSAFILLAVQCLCLCKLQTSELVVIPVKLVWFTVFVQYVIY